MAKKKFKVRQMVQAIRDTKGLVTLAAQRLSCDPGTVRNYARRHPSVATALRQERDKMTDIAELSLYNKIQAGEGWAVCFYLKTQGKDRGYVERQELTGSGGGPIELAAVTLAQRLQRIVDAEPSALPSGVENGAKPD